MSHLVDGNPAQCIHLVAGIRVEPGTHVIAARIDTRKIIALVAEVYLFNRVHRIKERVRKHVFIVAVWCTLHSCAEVCNVEPGSASRRDNEHMLEG